MSQKAARVVRAQAGRPPVQSTAPSRFRSPRALAAIVLAVAGLAAVAAFVAIRPSAPATPTTALAGDPAPAFSEQDVRTGQTVSSSALRGRNALLFFSEGVMCQACFEQIKGVEEFGAELDKRGIQLVSITPDSPDDLRRAVSQYGITTPMIADDDRDMSAAFNTLGQGMHGDTPGHAFALVSHGKVLWYRDYWLAPTRSMYIEPERLLADISTLDG